MAEKIKEVKIDIDNGPTFFADEVGVMHNPMRMIIDFRSVTPRIDIRNKDFQPLVLKHNVVMMDMFVAKNFLEILQNNVENYEKRFGKIDKPKALKKFEKTNRPAKKSGKAPVPNYFG